MKGMAIKAVVVVTGLLTSLFIPVVAQAQPPDVRGERYSKARSLLAKAGYRAQVGTKVGTDLPENRCWVVNAADLTKINWKGRQDSRPVRLDLHCYADPSSHMDPGFSAGNNKPEAEAVRADYEKKLDYQTRVARLAAKGNEWAIGRLSQVQKIQGVLVKPEQFDEACMKTKKWRECQPQ